MNTFLRLAAALLLAPALFAQTPAPAKAPANTPAPDATGPLIADVHPAPYRASIYYNTNVGQQRFDMRDATLLDIIALAYNKRDRTAILGGPTWIDFDRFDVTLGIPTLVPNAVAGPTNPANPYNQIRPVLQRLLTERFQLTLHTEDRPLPGYIVTVAKEGTKLTQAKTPDAPANCRDERDKTDHQQSTLICTSETIEQVLAIFSGSFPHPVIDRTGLKKTYDFTFKIFFGNIQTREQYISAYTDAANKQLGLVVALGDVSQPAIVVDKASRTPTPTPPEIAKLIPAPPNTEFEVASIKPTADTEPQDRMLPLGSQITFSGFSLQGLLVQAFDLPTGAMLGDALPRIGRPRWTILVKLPPDINARNLLSQDRDQLNHMLQKLLIDRFQIKYHWGEWTFPDAWVLLPSTPKMKKADPNSRTFCSRGPAEGEKDLTSTPDSPFDRVFHCQNVTMAQFADLAQSLAGSEIKNRVPDKSGITGSYDFTLAYSTTSKLRAQTSAAADAAKQAGGDTAAAPVAGMSLQDAMRKQLGLRIEKQPITAPSLVLDHFETTPTEN